MLIATLLLAAANPQAPAEIPPLFIETQKVAAPGVGLDDVSVRRRLTEIDIELLRETLSRPHNQGAIRLNFFDDEEVVASFNHIEQAYGNGWVWHGAVEGEADSSALFSVTEDAVAGSIRFSNRLFRVSFAGNAAHWVTEVDELQFKDCGTTDKHAVSGTQQGALHKHQNNGQSAQGNGGSARSGGNPDVDTMIVYTTSAKNGQGGASSMNSLINLAMTETNNGYTSSFVDQRLNLVHTEEMTGYSEPSSFSTMLSNLRGKSDGKLDNVHSLRDQYGADVVSMFVNGSQYCGIAYLMTSVSNSFESSAFSVVSRTCATGYYSTAHEFGHNMGSAHDRGNAGSASHSYAYGFRTSNNRYRTIMAYSPGTRINRWSNPNVTYSGYSMGNANSEENWRSLNDNASVVSGWRNHITPAPVLSIPSLFAGWPAKFDVTNTNPGDLIYVGYSLTGNGPTSTSWGNADLSPPLYNFPSFVADANGEGSYTTTVPASAQGMTVWFQALDATTSLFSNGLSATVL